MNQLWAPWRMAYIKGKRIGKGSCVFCQMVEQPENDIDRFVIARSSHTFAVLNRYPYAYAHTMVIPYRHLSSPEDMPTEALTDLMNMKIRIMQIMRELADPPAFNVGANIGAAAGAGMASHFHYHVVPRWPGDHSFMETIGRTRTIPDTLPRISEQMRDIWLQKFGSQLDQDT